MGGASRDFYSGDMYEFQSMIEAHKKKNGITDDEILTTDDLDDLYSKMQPNEE